MDGPSMDSSSVDGFLKFLSAAFGWIYVLLWSLSFYPQTLLNIRRQSTSGTTVDFPFLNVLGFASYFVSSAALYASAGVRRQYAARNDGLTPTVQLNDVAFGLHALLISLVALSQYFFATSLWRFPASSSSPASRRPSRFALGLTAGALAALAAIYTVVGARSAGRAADPAVDWCDLDVVYALGYVKLLVTLVKYAPQLLANARNRSTEGWAIGGILLDLEGGVLSIAQQGIDSYRQRDWSGITGNPAKFGLSQISIFFDVLFILQHYVVYRKDNSDADRRDDAEQLLPPGEERRLD